MGHTREVRTFASEIKFLVDPARAAAVREWARTELAPDPHGAGPHGDEYVTSTVYFDTDQLDVFHRRGSFGRSKYRIRRYGAAAIVFLERKLREPSVLAKRRSVAPLAMLDALETEIRDRSWAGYWFHARLRARRLRAICQISYRRMARVVLSGDDLVRLTLDDMVTAQPSTAASFRNGEGVPALDGHQILELKFRHHTPALFKQLVQDLALTPEGVSKYRLGMAATGQVPAAREEPPPIAGSDAGALHA
jgi:hypothetical protein